MSCSIPRSNRPDRAMELVLQMFREMERPGTLITPDTHLGHFGLGHTPRKRKAYHSYLSKKLALSGCSLGDLRPNDLANPRILTAGALATLVAVNIK